MSTPQRQRLMPTTAHEPARAVGALLQCAICMAFVTLLALIGSGSAPQEPPPATHALASRTDSPAKTSTAAAHRKEVFDGRRARFANEAPERGHAGTAPAARSLAHAR